MGHRQTVLTLIIHQIMWYLFRIFAVCLQNVILKFGGKIEIPPNGYTPKIGNELNLLIKVDKFLHLKWVICFQKKKHLV